MLEDMIMYQTRFRKKPTSKRWYLDKAVSSEGYISKGLYNESSYEEYFKSWRLKDSTIWKKEESLEICWSKYNGQLTTTASFPFWVLNI